ncbi:MAG: hypothetical protein ACLUOI_34780 [Eisenbergiella sp.]
MNILIFLIVGLSLGASILMSEYFGAKDYKALKRKWPLLWSPVLS